MPKYYKKGALGRMIEAEGGVSDPDLAEVRMTEKEYKGFRDRIHRAERAAEVAKSETKQQIDEARRQANQDLYAAKQKAEDEAQRRINIIQQSAADSEKKVFLLQEQLAQAEADLQHEKNLNRNMMRIMKERANQVRGIKPKKNHDGYIVLESRQWTQKHTEETWDTEDHEKSYADNRGVAIKKGYLKIEHKEAKVWKSTLQTPYDASLPLAQVRDRIEKDLGYVLNSIGCESRLKPEYNGKYYDFGINEEGYPMNGMYKWQYKANYKMGLWEVEIFTTKSLRVPDYRRPVSRMRNNTRKKTDGSENSMSESFIDLSE